MENISVDKEECNSDYEIIEAKKICDDAIISDLSELTNEKNQENLNKMYNYDNKHDNKNESGHHKVLNLDKLDF
jgi:hypothetical protein